ncbi:MAG: c-type cytochrome [Longimicrobiales bacterium]
MSVQEAEFAGTPRWKRWVAYGLILFVALSMGGALTVLRPRAVPFDSNPDRLRASDLAEVAVDLFQPMDGGVALSENEIKGRNTWMIWTGGNADFWNWLAQYGFGTNDLLKTLDSRTRLRRFRAAGLINEPGFRVAAQPDTFGLWLDERTAPPENVDERVYGRASGIVGLRLFRNPRFNARKWDAQRYYNDPSYYNNPRLERPYMVGMSCGFCHVGPHPLRPPADVENPGWENLSTNIGAQYFRTSQVFAAGLGEDNLVYQILLAMADGTLDTSFLATDNILNPSNMNAIFEVGGRLAAAEQNAAEEMGDATMSIRGQQRSMRVPHILKDGADNIGILGALIRVYVNIGEFHEQWLSNHNILVGGKAQTPFPIRGAQQKSIYWQSTESRVENLAAFFLKAAGPMPLRSAPGGSAHVTTDGDVLYRGKVVFAEHCASCHSSKRPPAGVDPESAAGRSWFRTEILKSDFQQGNFYSDDRRHAVSEIQTNACRALGTNAKRGHVWDNFSSETYKNSPPSGPIEIYNPFDGSTRKFQPQGGGPGYYRTPSLVSIWATAPFFHNNKLGEHTHDPSVAGRMRAFNSAAEQLLWPERRGNLNSIMRTTAESWLQIPTPYLPGFLQGLADGGDYLRIGPVPAGTPIKLIANLDMTLETPELDAADAAKLGRLAGLGRKMKNRLLQIQRQNLDARASADVLRQLVPDLLALSKCPDFIEDRGHYFGTTMTDSDKRALIEYLKTL